MALRLWKHENRLPKPFVVGVLRHPCFAFIVGCWVYLAFEGAWHVNKVYCHQLRPQHTLAQLCSFQHRAAKQK